MTTPLLRRFCSIAVLFLFLGWAQAQPPSGLVSIPFGNDVAPVWDLGGTLTLEQTMQGAGDQDVPLNFSVDVTQDASGKLSGSGITILNIGNDFVAADYTLTGKISGGGNSVNRASFTVKLSGQDVITGLNTRFSINLKYKLEGDVGQQAFVGTVKGNANFSGMSSAKIDTDVTVLLAPTMDGSWVLDMNILALNKLAGSANIVLPNGRVLPTELSGSFSPNSGVSKINLKGINEGKGTSLNLKLVNSLEGELVVDSMKGKILGQSVRQ